MSYPATPFWECVNQLPNGCWEWARARFSRGYGVRSVNGKARKAHRVAWEMVNGPIPAGMFVLHRCDNPPCVRPDHLFLGTGLDNQRDMTSKGRGRTGARNGMWRKARGLG